MKILKTVHDVRKLVNQWKKESKTIGLVPTMGYLHEGHLSLIEKCKKENDKVIVSIFVNPTQFGENEDLTSYPKDIKRDSSLCENLGVDLIFNPDASEMYQDPCTFVNIESLSNHLCGKSRPIHFRGVCTIVSKLFIIINPDNAYFGQKDAQQLAIIKKMVKDLNFDINIVGCPIVREEDGLAKSSRNVYLNPKERKAALCLSKAINVGKTLANTETNADKIKSEMRKIIEAEPLAKIDYIEIVDNDTMQPVSEMKENTLAAMAVFIGKTRLIDNFIKGGDLQNA